MKDRSELEGLVTCCLSLASLSFALSLSLLISRSRVPKHPLLSPKQPVRGVFPYRNTTCCLSGVTSGGRVGSDLLDHTP